MTAPDTLDLKKLEEMWEKLEPHSLTREFRMISTPSGNKSTFNDMYLTMPKKRAEVDEIDPITGEKVEPMMLALNSTKLRGSEFTQVWFDEAGGDMPFFEIKKPEPKPAPASSDDPNWGSW